MYSKPFKVAYIEIDSSNMRELTWLTGNGKPYVEMEALEFEDDFLDKIYEIYKNTYLKIDSILFLKDKFQLLKYTRWILLINERRDIKGFFICKDHEKGVKLGLLSSVESEEAKTALKTFCRRAFNIDGVFGEVSPPLERAIIGHVPELNAETAQKVLGPDKKIYNVDEDKKHYSRNIKNIGEKKKMMVGRPLLD